MNDKIFLVLIVVVLILAFAISHIHEPLTANNEIILMAHFYQ